MSVTESAAPNATDTAFGHGSPLAGVRVVEFAGLAPSSVAGMVLADLGAEVIRIDRPGHPADRATNPLRRGRRSAMVDLKAPDSMLIIGPLVERADIVIEPYRPGVMERLGLGPDDLIAMNPRLVYGRLTGWGQDGPYAQRAGHDINYLAITGVLAGIGPRGTPPTPPLNVVADMGGGAMLLLVGVIAALHRSRHFGVPAVIDANMIDGVALLSSSIYRSIGDGSWKSERSANVLDGGAPFYRTYECADGKYVAVGAIEPKFYGGLLNTLALDPNEIPDRSDRTNWPALSERFAEQFRTQRRAHWLQLGEKEDACLSPVIGFDELNTDPHVSIRRVVPELDGKPMPPMVPRFLGEPDRVVPSSPEAGADTQAIADELGLTDSDLAHLVATGAIPSTVADLTESAPSSESAP